MRMFFIPLGNEWEQTKSGHRTQISLDPHTATFKVSPPLKRSVLSTVKGQSYTNWHWLFMGYVLVVYGLCIGLYVCVVNGLFMCYVMVVYL